MSLTVARWYGQGERRVEAASGTAVWYHSGLPPVPLRWVLVRDPEGRFEPQALLCTDPAAEPGQVIEWFVSRWPWFVSRWPVESTFQQVRAHLGVETQRQGSDAAILRTTPALLGLFSLGLFSLGLFSLGLFSLVTLLAPPHMDGQVIRQAAWYKKKRPTFSDALALVRRRLWRQRFEGLASFCMSGSRGDRQKPPPPWAEQMAEMLCYAN